MNKFYKRIILGVTVILLFSFKYRVYAIENINFNKLTIEDGLSQATVNNIIQDRYGYIWIGTEDGLNRYNGYEFKVYKHDLDDKNTIANNYIISIKEDINGDIWVGTVNGLSIIDVKNNVIKNYTTDYESGNLSNNIISGTLITSDGNILVGTANGLNIYDRKENRFFRILEGKLSSEAIYSMSEDVNGDIWIATEHGIDKIDINENKIKSYLTGTKLDKVYSDRDNSILVGSFSEGIYKIDIDSEEIINYKHDEDNENSLAGDKVKNFLRDSRGNLWICTSKGLSLYNEKNDNFINYKNKYYDKYSILSDETFSIMEDKSGMVWVGTYSGVSKFNLYNNIEHYKYSPEDNNSIADNVIRGIYEDSDGFMWVGTNDKGISVIDRDNKIVHNINNAKYEKVLSNENINDITGKDNYIFIGTDSGLTIINKNDKNSIIIDKILNEEDLEIIKLYLDSKNNLWISTTKNIYIMDVENNRVKDLGEILRKYRFPEGYIRAIYEDVNGEYWLGSSINGGLIRLNPSTMEIKIYNKDERENSLVANSIKVITEDIKGNLWIGANGGISKFDIEQEKFENYTMNDGLPGNNIYGILLDDYENLWISTNLGISNFDVSDGMFYNYNTSDGLQSNEFNCQAYFRNSKGEMFFGGINGLNVFNPNEVKEGKWIPKTNFDFFEVNGKEIDNLDGKVLKNNENTIKINLFSSNYKDVRNIKYYYILEGDSNEEWRELNNNCINFSNLKYGKYRLRVLAKNSMEKFTEEEVIEFEIEPPFLLRKGSILVGIIIVGLLIIHSKYKVKYLDRIVYMKTRELREEMEKNKKLFDRIIELEQRKNSYFINLSHELRTPLNVLHTTEQLITSLNNTTDGINKKKLDYYMKVTRNNNSRLLKIISDLIDASKFENGNYKLNMKEENIIDIVEEAALTLKEYIENKGISLIIDPEIEEKYIMCDKNEIERCIINLIGNAVKFTPIDGKIEVLIFDMDDKVKIQVKDTGVGIEEEHYNLIFDRFNQVVDKNSEVKGGSGLGLTITKHIVGLHNGVIYVESEVGKGSTFTIVL